MEITDSKTIAFKVNAQEAKELTATLDLLKIDYAALSSREIIVLLAQKASEAVEAVNALTNGNQSVNSELMTELTENNQKLTELNQELTENNQELTQLNQQLILDGEELSAKYIRLESAVPQTTIVEKPIQLSQYQLLIELNYFQLALLAKVANHHSVESLYNKQAQLNPAAFIRIEGQPKERLSQTLVNVFMGVQFNYHKGNIYLPENTLSGDDIKKAFKRHEENQV